MTKPLDGQVALVTGASRGIGAATALALARLGAHVVITARTVGGLEETDDAIRAGGGASTLLPLDLTETASVDVIGPSLFERFRRLDILVHAAGVLAKLTPAPHIQDADWAGAVAVNLSAGFRLIRATAPLLLAAEAGRAVFVTDALVRQPRAYWGTYGATKAGLEHLVRCWAEETRTTRLRINLFDPGAVATKLRASAMPGEDPATLPTPADVAPMLAGLCLPGETRHGAVVSFTANAAGAGT
jgi:NAD(P)-dependent dehydrogenase (short-subunit alcohol dehydrogenase family)